MEDDSEVLLEYGKINRLSLNKDKTKVIMFRPYASRSNAVFKISVGDTEVNETDTVTYLGMLFQSNLQWNKHKQSLKKKQQQP